MSDTDEKNGWGSWPQAKAPKPIDPKASIMVELTAEEIGLIFAAQSFALDMRAFIQPRQIEVVTAIAKKMWAARQEFDK